MCGTIDPGSYIRYVDALFASSSFFFFGGPLHKYEKIFLKKRIIT
jgi:hypothetical protein